MDSPSNLVTVQVGNSVIHVNPTGLLENQHYLLVVDDQGPAVPGALCERAPSSVLRLGAYPPNPLVLRYGLDTARAMLAGRSPVGAVPPSVVDVVPGPVEPQAPTPSGSGGSGPHSSGVPSQVCAVSPLLLLSSQAGYLLFFL